MPENDNNQEVLDAISQMSFLPPKAIDINATREFPILKKKESLFRLVFAAVMSVCALVFIVLLFVYGGPSNKNFNGEKGYGVLGLITTALFALTLAGTQWVSYLFDTKWTLEKDEKKVNQKKAIVASTYYLAFALFFLSVFTTMLRPAIISTFSSLQGYGYVTPLAIILFILVLAIAIGGAVLNFVKPGDLAKFVNYAVMAFGLWILLIFSFILTKSYSITNAGIFLHIWAPIISLIAVVFLFFQKHTYCKSIGICLFSFTYFIEFALILSHAMLNAAYMG